MTLFRTLWIAGFAAWLAGCASSGPQPGSVQRLTPEQLARIAPTPNPAIPLSEIMALSKAGTPPGAIIKRLADTGTVHVLSATQIVNLATHGVDQKVIDALVEAQERSRQTTLMTQLADRDAQEAQRLEFERQRLWQAQRYYYDPFWDPYWPRLYFGYGFGYYRGYRRW